ncbi:MAG: cellulose synthase subunit BcsC-related outer membrane protein, partial [Solimonas sp.]
ARGGVAGATTAADGGHRLATRLGNGDGVQAGADGSRYGTPITLQFERHLRVPTTDSQWVAPFSAEQVPPMDRLAGQVSGWVLGGFESRARDGESGLGQLYDLETPVDWASTQWRGGRVAVRIRPVYLDAGSVSSAKQLLKFGTLALTEGELDDTVPTLDQSDSGIALAAAWQLADFTADIGTTPLGLRITNLVGGIAWTPSFDALSLKLDFSRRAVTDSLLSYAGAYDPLTGRDWGGLTRTGGRIDAAYDFGNFGLYGNGAYYSITGRNVEQNSEFDLGGGLFLRAYQRGSQTLTVGLNLTTFSYDNNLRYYTFGQGGYFSPKFFGAVTLPVSFTGTWGALSYRADLALGIQSFRENSSALYPNNANLQAELVDNLDVYESDYEDLDLDSAYYSSQKNSGLAYRLGGAVQYRVNDRFHLGGSLGVDNARDYQEMVLTGYLRWYFSGVQPQPLEPQVPNAFKGPLP